MEIRREFEDEEDFQAYLFETGSLYYQEVDGEQIIFMNPDLCEHYAKEYYDLMIEEINNALVQLLEEGKINVRYEPEITDDGEVKMNPFFEVPDDFNHMI